MVSPMPVIPLADRQRATIARRQAAGARELIAFAKTGELGDRWAERHGVEARVKQENHAVKKRK